MFFLAYDHGKLDPNNQIIKYWITSDYVACRKSKSDFISDSDELRNSVSLVGSAFADYGMLMYDACYMVKEQRHKRAQEAHEVFVQGAVPKGVGEHSAAMWDQFIPILSKRGLDTTRLQKHRPIFDRAQCQDLFDEMKVIYNSLDLPA